MCRALAYFGCSQRCQEKQRAEALAEGLGRHSANSWPFITWEKRNGKENGNYLYGFCRDNYKGSIPP